MEDEIDISKHILIVLLILTLSGAGYLYYLRTQDQNKIEDLESQYSQLKTKYNTFLSKQTASPTPIATSDWKTYTNGKYGFTLTFDNAWQGYKYEQDTTTYDDNGIHYRFYLPTKDSDYETEKTGYASPFVISVYKLSDWEEMDNQDDFTKIDENSKYVFVYGTWKKAPTDLENTITSDEIKKVIGTFEFTESE